MSQQEGLSKLESAENDYASKQGPGPDGHLDEARKNRTYNPVDEATRGNVSEALNQDAAKYKQGPGPV